MKVFVTVGTGSFDQLIEQVDSQLRDKKWSVTCQIGNGLYQPKHNYVRLCDDFSQQISKADIVITHAGAGTVFELLDRGKKMLVVPNLYRIDKHQQDLARFVEKNQFGAVCWSLDNLLACLDNCAQTSFTSYHKDPFFMADELEQYFGF